MKVLVTGAAGFIGSHLCEALLRRGDHVIGVDNFDPFYDRALKEQNLREVRAVAENLRTRFEFFELDFTGVAELERLPADVEVIFHLGAKAGVRPSLQDPAAYIHTNITGSTQILEWGRRHGVRHFVMGSSSSVYGNSTPAPFSETAVADQPYSPYAMTKRSMELLCSTWADLYQLHITSLRFFTVYGPRQRPDLAIRLFAGKILKGETLHLFGDGSSSRDYTHVSDIVRGILAADEWTRQQSQHQHQIFNLGGDRRVSLKQLVGQLEQACGKPALTSWTANQLGDVEQTCADLTKSRRSFGYQPQISLEQGLTDFVRWLKEQSS